MNSSSTGEATFILDENANDGSYDDHTISQPVSLRRSNSGIRTSSAEILFDIEDDTLDQFFDSPEDSQLQPKKPSKQLVSEEQKAEWESKFKNTVTVAARITSPLFAIIADYRTSPDGKDSFTHGFMGFAKFISWDIKREKFLLDAYYTALFQPNGEYQPDPEDFCMCQCLSSPFFNFACDVDLHSTNGEISTEFGAQLALLFSETISVFFPQFQEKRLQEWLGTEPIYDESRQQWMGAGDGANRYRVLLCASGNKCGVNKKGITEWSRGFHLYSIGRIAVTPKEGMVMAIYFRNLCEKTFGPRTPELGENEWSSVIDMAFYKNGGSLRMLWASKIAGCDKCSVFREFNKSRESEKRKEFVLSTYPSLFGPKSKKSLSGSILRENSNLADSASNSSNICIACKGTAFLLKRNVYHPLQVFNAKGMDTGLDDLFRKDKRQYIYATSIRNALTEDTLPQSERFRFPDFLGEIDTFLSDNNATTKKKDLLDQHNQNIVIRDKLASEIHQRYAPDSKEFIIAVDEISNLHPNWNDITPHELVKTGELRFRLSVKKNSRQDDPAKYCNIKGDYHHANSIYFTISPWKIQQHCWNKSKCFKKHSAFPISQDLLTALFDLSKIPKKVAQKYVPKSDFSTLIEPFVPEIIEEDQFESVEVAYEAERFLTFYENLRQNWVEYLFPDQARNSKLDARVNHIRKRKGDSTDRSESEKPPKKTSKPKNAPLSYIDDNGNVVSTIKSAPIRASKVFSWGQSVRART